MQTGIPYEKAKGKHLRIYLPILLDEIYTVNVSPFLLACLFLRNFQFAWKRY